MPDTKLKPLDPRPPNPFLNPGPLGYRIRADVERLRKDIQGIVNCLVEDSNLDRSTDEEKLLLLEQVRQMNKYLIVLLQREEKYEFKLAFSH